MAAFVAAYELGFRCLETDVHASADGVAVVHHDASLDRIVGTETPIDSLPAAELTSLTVDGHLVLPTLAQLFETFPDATFCLDAKSDGVVEPLCAEIARHQRLDSVCLGSFEDQRVIKARQILGAALCTSPGPKGVARVVAAANRMGPMPDERIVQLPHRVQGRLLPRWLIKRIQALGVQVHAWTVNDVEDMRAVLDLGVDGVISDETVDLKTVLQQRGEWNHG